MRREEQIALARRIAERLPEVTRNEWMRWMQVAEKYGLEKAIHYAERLSRDVTVRPAVQRANRFIAQSVRAHLRTLRSLEEEERRRVFGYVAWWLKIMTLRGSLQG